MGIDTKWKRCGSFGTAAGLAAAVLAPGKVFAWSPPAAGEDKIVAQRLSRVRREHNA